MDVNIRREHLTPQKRVYLYISIIDLLKASEEVDGNDEVLELFGERGSQRFWNKLNPAVDEARNRQLKHKIKERIKHENDNQKGRDTRRELDHNKILLQPDGTIAPTPEDLADLLMQLNSTCHRIAGGTEWRDGVPPMVTVGDSFERYTHGKRGAWKAGDMVVKGHKRKKRVIVLGLKDKAIETVVDKLRRIAHCTCSVKTLDYGYWSSLFGEYTDPMADEGSRVVSLSIAEGSEALFPIMQILEEVVPQEYRRYISEEKETVQAQPLEVEADDLYHDMIQESASIELTEIYRKHAPEKIADIPTLLKKYSGREEKLLKVVRKKYVTSASRLDVVPEQDVAEKEESKRDAAKVNQGPAKKATVPTWETDDFSAFL